MAHRPEWLTIEQTLGLLHTLDASLWHGHPELKLTLRKLRYWDAAGAIPVGRADRTISVSVRLYAATDIALVRVALRLLRAGLSMQQVSAALRYRNAEICAAFGSRRPMAVVFTRGRLDVMPATDAPPDAIAVVSLQECWHGMLQAVRATLRNEPTVWVGWTYQPASALVAMPSV